MMKTFLDTQPLGTLYFDEVYFVYDEPQLFTCANLAGQKFFAVLSDFGDEHVWFLSAISPAALAELKSNRRDINSLFTNPELNYIWRIVSNDEQLAINQVDPQDVSPEDLPTEGFYLNLKDDSVSDLPDLVVQASSERRDIFDLAIEKRDSHIREIDCTHLGTILNDTQHLIYALALEEDQLMGPIPKSIRESCNMQVAGTFAASFGVRLKSDDLSNLEMKTPVTDVLNDLSELLEIKDDAEKLSAYFSRKSRRAILKYRSFMKSIASADSGIKVECASPNRTYHNIHYTNDEIKRNLAFLEREVDKITDTQTLVGRLIGVEVKDSKSTFVFVTVEDETIKGTISDSLASTVFEVPHSATITVERTIGTNPFTNEETYMYKLLSCEMTGADE